MTQLQNTVPIDLLETAFRSILNVEGVKIQSSAKFATHAPPNILIGEFDLNGNPHVKDDDDDLFIFEDDLDDFEYFPFGVPVFSEARVAIDAADIEGLEWWTFHLPPPHKPYWSGPIWYTPYDTPAGPGKRSLNLLEALTFIHMYKNVREVRFSWQSSEDDYGSIKRYDGNDNATYIIPGAESTTCAAYVEGESNFYNADRRYS